MEGENIPTATVTAGSSPSGSTSAALPTPRTLLQVYAACKQLDLDFRFGAGHRTVGGILLGSRSLYRYFSNPFIGLLGFHIVEAYPAPMYYSSGKHSFYFEVCSASRKMYLTVEVPDPELFKSIRSKLFKRYSASAANAPRPATILFGKWARIDETHSSMQLTSPKQLHILR